MAVVKNLNETSDKKCTCSGSNSWLEHWEKRRGTKANYCKEVNCVEKTDLVGAHVKKEGGFDNSHYIIPLCKKHNGISDSFVVADELVSATCQ